MSILKTIIPPSKKTLSLQACLLLDAIGMFSYLGLAYTETFDVLWAPISAFIMYYKFGSKMLPATIFQFVEEVLPFTDFIPTFTLTWLYSKYFSKPEKPEIVKSKTEDAEVLEIK